MSLAKTTLLDLFELFHPHAPHPEQATTSEAAPVFYCICCDQDIVEQWARTFFKNPDAPTQTYHGPKALPEWAESLNAFGLFGVPPPAIVHLEGNLSAAQKKNLKEIITSLPKPLPSSVCFIAATTARQALADVGEWHAQAQGFICYDPAEKEVAPMARLLAFQHLPYLPARQLDKLTNQSLEHYANDFLAIHGHFERMHVLATTEFSHALAGEPEVTAFHVTDALAAGQKDLVALRIQQCEAGGVEALSIFFAVVSFLKQYLSFMRALSAPGTSEKEAFSQAGIPYPGERRMREARKHLIPAQVVEFFLSAAELEYELKVQKNAYGLLGQSCVNLVGL